MNVMRLAGTAIVCVLVAFGAAFLVAHAVIHQTPARAATTHAASTPLPTVRAVGTNHNAELLSQFGSMTVALKHKPKAKPKVRHHASAPAPAPAQAAPSQSTPTTPYTAPQTTTPYTPTPAPSTPRTTRRKSGGSSNSGTTTIG